MNAQNGRQDVRACKLEAPIGLRCEYAADPLGVDLFQPRFSWVLESSHRGQMQSAYQVLVAGSEENLRAGVGSKWDSGVVASDQSVNVPYQGRPLSSGEVMCPTTAESPATSPQGGPYCRKYQTGR